MIVLETIELPDFGRAEVPPAIPVFLYRNRLDRARKAMRAAGLDVLVVYGDREHFANLAYLTGFDPRFEEALLLLDAEGPARLLAGNECMGYLPDPEIGIEVECFQELSLMGQARDDSRPLRAIFETFGIAAGKTVGCAGWKYFRGALLDRAEDALELPAYIVDLLRDLVGGPERVRNATALFMDPDTGLRTINEPEQIAFFEYAATVTSEAVRAVIRNLRPGVTERDLQPRLDSRGLPLSCHPMISFGEKTRRGLSSPSANAAQVGDPFTVAFGVTGHLTCRAGCVARGPEDLPEETRSFYPDFAAAYFDVVAAWYEAVAVGASAGDVFDAVERRRRADLFDFCVNPGHVIHLDEWVHSPFAAGSGTILQSGTALQMDIIPVSKGPLCCINAEDGIVLADAALRAALADRFPAALDRMRARRAFMRDALGLRIDDSVLPLGNTPGWLPPYALAPERVFVRRGQSSADGADRSRAAEDRP